MKENRVVGPPRRRLRGWVHSSGGPCTDPLWYAKSPRARRCPTDIPNPCRSHDRGLRVYTLWYYLPMGLRCKVGLHDWDGYLRRRIDPRRKVVWLIDQTCRRCGDEQRLWLNPLGIEPSPEGTEVLMPSANGSSGEGPTHVAYGGEQEGLPCVRPGTRTHGTLRDGTPVVNSACGHAYRDHMSYRYFGSGKFGFRSVGCRNCSCEGFLG